MKIRQIKIFSANSPGLLEDSVNDFIKDIDIHSILDITYKIGGAGNSHNYELKFSVMIQFFKDGES